MIFNLNFVWHPNAIGFFFSLSAFRFGAHFWSPLPTPLDYVNVLCYCGHHTEVSRLSAALVR